MVAQLWNIAFCFNNDLFPHWLYVGQRKRFRDHSGVEMIAYGFLLREESKCCWHNTEGKVEMTGWRLSRKKCRVLHQSVFPQVAVLTLLWVTSSSCRQACLSHLCTTFIYWSQRDTLMWAVDLLSYLMTTPVEQTIVSVQNSFSWISKSPTAQL